MVARALLRQRNAAGGRNPGVQVARRITPIWGQYRSKRTVVPSADELLPINMGAHPPESAMTLEPFVEHTYLPYIAAQKRPSTFRAYRNMCEGKSHAALRRYSSAGI